MFDWWTGGPTHSLKNEESFRIELFFLSFFQQKNIGASIHIGQDIQCLPYARFLKDWIKHILLVKNKFKLMLFLVLSLSAIQSY